MYFILGGVGEAILQTPQFASPGWTDRLAGSFGPVPGGLVTIALPLLVWGVLLHRSALGVPDAPHTAEMPAADA